MEINRAFLEIALYQVTKGLFDMEEIKKMSNKVLKEQWEYYSNMTTNNSRE